MNVYTFQVGTEKIDIQADNYSDAKRQAEQFFDVHSSDKNNGYWCEDDHKFNTFVWNDE